MKKWWSTWVSCVFILLLCSCTSEKAAQHQDAVQQLHDQLTDVTEYADEMIQRKDPEDAAKQVSEVYGQHVHQYSATRNRASWLLVLTADASYDDFITHKTVVLGTCIAVTASVDEGVEENTVPCPPTDGITAKFGSITDEVDILP